MGPNRMSMEFANLEQRTLTKVSVRLVPFLIVCYFVAYLDRVNVGFAALTMNSDLGISDAAFGFGAGIFFFSYFVFEVPSNLALERFGARKWIARIMLTWGLLSGAMAFVRGETGFYVVRVLLGAAEAGFFPGIIFYLTLWFPATYRARIVGYFMAAIPLSSVIGAPVSSMLLGLDGVAGFKGWQWLFIMEAVPAVILAVVVWFYLTDRPSDAHWLATDERDWLIRRLAAERAQREAVHQISVMQALANPKVLALAIVYFGAVATNYGTAFWLPQIVKSFGISNVATGFVTAIPYVIGTIGMVWYGRRSDRQLERKGHAALALALAALGIGVSTMLNDPVLKMVSLSVGAFGVFAVLPVFWTLPTAFLSGASAAAGIAAINSLGNLAGFAGPYAMGAIKGATGSFTGGLLFIALLAVVAMVVVLSLHHDPALEEAPGTGRVGAPT
jgi:MFS transporter, ACS family, tartrate transporter